ncbi:MULTISPECIES: HAD family hydrolase [Gordonibacter]|uniref:HAD family hydrolase n=1 Tax=Gordonibacter faecis TaxID=3047475 RepID=A0ABT7DMB4_9ACTN|nr:MULTISPECIES: HAD family hydrolase [unclassified Gordonibacter]MDJ1650680.1 HAD family hydrolase [Gordonibacter sp. KGMB12511]HIW75846.1 HAD family hydrolase [Candidatus Gordonibacter avicola]
MTQPGYRAVFFDLDGTLLPMEIDEFMRSYFGSLGAYVARFGVSPEAFMAGMKAGIKNMAAHDDSLPNAEAFWEGYFAHVDREACDWPVELDHYYEHEFGKIGADVVPNPAAARAVNTLVAKGYPLVLATMPMFPERAVRWRLAWAGIDPSQFARLTHFQNSTSVKPKATYYAENLAACGVAGEDVLMVGNNTVEDFSICALGADAYLVTDHLLDPTDHFDLATVKHGTMEEFAAWAEALPACANPATDIEAGLVPTAARDAALASNLTGDAPKAPGKDFSISGMEG